MHSRRYYDFGVSNFLVKTFRIYFSWRMLTVLLMGFSSGVPLGLTGSTLQAWMTNIGVDLSVVGVFALVGLPYALKFVWSPIMDRYVPPLLGRRRGWMIVAQVALVLSISGMAMVDPQQNLLVMGALALAVAFFSASQDIVIDAFRVEVLQPDELGAGSSLAVQGYRIGMIVSGAAAMIMAEHMPWSVVYYVMAATMAVGICTTLLTPEPKVNTRPPQTLGEAIVYPFWEFLTRRGAIEMLLFILVYKLDVAVAQGMTTPFMLKLGFSTGDIGTVTKGYGLAAMIIGSLVGGAAMARIGLYRSLWVFGLAQGLSGLSFTLLAVVGHNYAVMVGAIVVEYFCAGAGVTAFTAFLMSLCSKRFTATQYALLSSFMRLSAVLIAVPTGWLAKSVGWPVYFIIATLIAIPGLALLLRYRSWEKEPRESHLPPQPAEAPQLQETVAK